MVKIALMRVLLNLALGLGSSLLYVFLISLSKCSVVRLPVREDKHFHEPSRVSNVNAIEDRAAL